MRSESLLKVEEILNIFIIIFSLLILISLSYDILNGVYKVSDPSFITFQLVICIVFIIDWFIRLSLSKNKWRFITYNWIVIVLSIPYLNIIAWCDISTSHTWLIAAKAAPLLRGFYALILLSLWMSRRSAERLALGYFWVVLSFTYFAALVFFGVEREINPNLHSFGDSLWWACMNMATVGSNVIAVTTIGKVLSVILPLLGMIMLPLFTAFAIEFFKSNSNHKHN